MSQPEYIASTIQTSRKEMVYDDLNRFLDVRTIAVVKVRDGWAVERPGIVIRAPIFPRARKARPSNC
jgi:hypothetical protein